MSDINLPALAARWDIVSIEKLAVVSSRGSTVYELCGQPRRQGRGRIIGFHVKEPDFPFERQLIAACGELVAWARHRGLVDDEARPL